MIADPRVFDDEFVPADLLHRESELERLLRRFTAPDDHDVLISGPSGVGKTALTTKAAAQVHDETGVAHVFVNALGKTTAGILRSVATQLPAGPNSIARTTPTDKARRLLREAIDGETIVVLDEGDDLPETDAIRELRSMRDVTVVAIAHDGTSWLSRLDVDDAHPLDNGHLELGRYSTVELADILERRAIQGLHGSVVSRGQLEAIADEVAGVAREGIQTLFAAAELADERAHYTIEDDDVDDAYERARHRIRVANLKSLPFHHQVLYAIVHSSGGELTGGELHDQYEALTDVYRGRPVAPIGARARREKFQKLVDYDLVATAGETKDRIYRVIDVDVEPVVELPSLRFTNSKGPRNPLS